MKVLNISSHDLTSEQIEGLGDLLPLSQDLAARVKQCPMDVLMLRGLAWSVRSLALEMGCTHIFAPGGSPAFMAILAQECADDLGFIFSHTERVSVDTVLPDGSISKTSVFKHLGFQVLEV